MTDSPFFSIIVPIYKVERYLRQCVDTLLDQDFADYEVVLVDDGSPDTCPAICDEYATKDSRIRVVHKPNGGLSDARNAGIAVAKGRYITFVDSDDFWRGSDVLSGVRRVIEDNDYPDVVVSDFIKYFEQTDKYLDPSIICAAELNARPKQEMLEYLYYDQADLKISAWQKFVKRELLADTLFEKGLLSEDIDWTLKLYPKVRSICVYPKPYYCYRQQREGSISNSISARSFDNLMYIIDKWSNEVPKLDIPDAEKEIYLGYLAYQLSICMSFYFKLKDYSKADFLKRIKSYRYLFSLPHNRKTAKVYKLIRTVGIKKAAILLSCFVLIRSRLNMK